MTGAPFRNSSASAAAKCGAPTAVRPIPASAMVSPSSQIAAQHCRPVSDQRGPADYKRHLAAELTGRALRAALRRARGGDA